MPIIPTFAASVEKFDNLNEKRAEPRIFIRNPNATNVSGLRRKAAREKKEERERQEQASSAIASQ